MGIEVRSGSQKELGAAQSLPGYQSTTRSWTNLQEIWRRCRSLASDFLPWICWSQLTGSAEESWEGTLGIYRNQRSLNLVLQPPDPSLDCSMVWPSRREKQFWGFLLQKKCKIWDFLSQGFPSFPRIWLGSLAQFAPGVLVAVEMPCRAWRKWKTKQLK